MKSPKKIIGHLGRRYGGKPFLIIRKICYDTADFVQDVSEILDIRQKRYPKNSEEEQFYNQYYTDSPGKASKGGIICMYDGRIIHGGLTDRLRGLLTTYREAKKRGIPFYILWNSPFELSAYLEPAEVDWRIDESEISYAREEAFPLIIQDLSFFNNRHRLDMALHKPRLQTHVYSNADNAIGGYAALFHELFKPSAALQKHVDYHLGKLGSNYHAYTFRFLELLGDFTDFQKDKLSGKALEDFEKKVIGEFKSQIDRLDDDVKILVTSDSRKFLDLAADIDPRIYIVPGEVKNIDLLKGEYPDAWMKTFIDQQLLMHASHVTLMITGKMYNSGFPRFAAEVGGAQYSIHRF